MEFFAAIKYFKKKLSRESIQKTFVAILNKKVVRDLIIEANQQQMYELGQDSEGNKIGEYSEVTIGIKKSKRQRYDHMTLKDTGAFYESMVVKVEQDGFIIDADTIKVAWDGAIDLLDVYGEDILGLNKENKELLREIVLDEFISEFKKIAA